jgi:hypothetical protein
MSAKQLVAHRRGEDDFSAELPEGVPLEVLRRRDDDVRALHRLAKQVLVPARLDFVVDERARRHPVAHAAGARGVGLERLERGEQLGNPELQQRIGEADVARVLRERACGGVVAHPREEESARVVEVVGLVALDVPNRPLIVEAAQHRAGGHRNRRRSGLELLRHAVLEARGADDAVVVDHSESDDVGFALPMRHQPHRAVDVPVGAVAANADFLAQEIGLELIVAAAGSETDADDGLHCAVLSQSMRRAAMGAAPPA